MLEDEDEYEESEEELEEVPDVDEDEEDEGGGEEFPIGTKNLSSAMVGFARNNRLADNPKTVWSLR